MREVKSGGGWAAIRYVLRKSHHAGGLFSMWKALRTKNACKTCALGMGGQKGGMVNERGSFPEVCKKSVQAMAADMQGAIPDDFWSHYSLRHLQMLSPYDLEHCGRLTQPVIATRGASHYQRITWDEALGKIIQQLRGTDPQQTFWYFSGRSSNEAAFLLQLFVRLYGTNHVNNCSFFCHQASGVGLTSSIGSGTATITLQDLEHADLVFLIGGNPASNHPRLMSTLKHIRRRGGKVIVVNPVIETGLVTFRVPSDPWSLLFGTRIATRYVQPHIGGDLALLTGVAKRIDEMGAADEEFLNGYSLDSELWREHLRQIPWSEIYHKSGVTAQEIQGMADDYAQAKNAVFAWTMGITHHTHGVANVQAIANLALMRGMVGRPHAGLLPIRGHSNVQGIGSMGVTPRLKDAIFERLQSEFGLQLPTTPGLDTLGCVEAAHAGHMRIAVCLGGNLYGSNPDAQFAKRALGNLELIVYLNTTLNTGHAHGLAKETVILPVLARDEEPCPTTQESMFNFVRLSDGGPPRHEGPKSEIEVIARLAEGLLGSSGPIHWQHMVETRNIRQMIAQVVPGWERMKSIDETKQEFSIDGRILHRPQFATPHGKAILHRHTLPDLNAQGDSLRLMTVRSEGQFNTVVYDMEDLYRGQERRDVILIHPEDLQRLGIQANQRVTVYNETGELSHILVRPFPRIRVGNALMYYPEANALVPRQADPASRTPAFKNVLIHIRT